LGPPATAAGTLGPRGPASGGPAILLTTINAKWIHPSLALRLLKANLGRLEGDCEILEFALRQPLAEKLGALQSRRPRILGISLAIWNHIPSLELLEALEKAWGAEPPVVVLGGPEASYLPAGAEIFRHADYVIRGEGEGAFRELCETLLGETPVRRKRSGEGPGFITGTPADLDRIRQAYHYYDGEDLARKLVYVESVRGCPFHCGFCQSAAPGFGGDGVKRVRQFPLGSFLAEMDALINRGARNFKFLDRSFNADTGRALEIMDFFLRHIGAGSPLRVHFEMVPGFFSPALRERLRRFPAGTLRVEIGIQTLNPRTAALVRRPEYGIPGPGEGPLEILRFLHEETGATIHADLIAALPGETFDSFAEGFDKLWLALSGPALQAGRVEIQLGILKILPGTPLAREAGALCHAAAPPYEVLSTAALPRPGLDRIKNFARFWELLINRRPFPELPIAAPGKAVFGPFMELSDRLLLRLGRNWGIDRGELRAAVVELL
jgi:radical SAM superfamily enzyme YgiQ (UPF0313 family)